MMILFVFFVLPLSTILLAIVLQKILKSPILVAITFFAVYLIIAFLSFSANLAVAIIAVIVYTIIAYITALLVRLFYTIHRRLNNCNNNSSNDNCECCEDICNHNNNNDITQNGVAVTANIVPTNNNNGRTGCIRGCYRRL